MRLRAALSRGEFCTSNFLEHGVKRTKKTNLIDTKTLNEVKLNLKFLYLSQNSIFLRLYKNFLE